MENNFEKIEVEGTLSPSSLQMYLSCNRKYYLKKIANIPPDSDADLDTKPFMVGKAFHKVLEDTSHKLDGLPLSKVLETCKEFELSHDESVMVGAMLAKYKLMHKKSGLETIACEIELNTENFRGFVDVLLSDHEGGWWIGDMKTSASYNPAILPTLPGHIQLNLYASHVPQIAKAFKLKVKDFKGCRYRLTTKSKMIRKNGEGDKSYFERIFNAVKSLDVVLPKAILDPKTAAASHLSARNKIQNCKDPADYPENRGNCMNYNKPCEFWSNCHSFEYTRGPVLEIIEG